jgi:lincosamide nucleotidyltransferase A/C/D/E
MTADDVLEILSRLDRGGIEWWLDGGWGVDALVGEQTRPHDDLDLAVLLVDIERLAAVLPEFHHVRQEEWPSAYVLRDERGRHVDFHPLELDADGNGLQPQVGGGHAVWPHEALASVGWIRDRAVRCRSPEFQLESHLYAGHDDIDWHDMRVLCERFGFTPPEPRPPGFIHEKRRTVLSRRRGQGTAARYN